MAITNSSHDKELDILKLLVSRKLLPREISATLGLDLNGVHTIVSSLLEKGLVSKMSDGFSTFLFITPRGHAFLSGDGGDFRTAKS